MSTEHTEQDTVKALKAQLRDLRAERDEEHNWRMRLHEQVAGLEKRGKELDDKRVALANSLVLEYIDLAGRLLSIEHRIYALGFDPPKILHKAGDA